MGWTPGRENDNLDEERAGDVARLQVSPCIAVIFSRGPVWVGDGINKKHTADIHRGRFLSFVYHACSVHNCVGLAGKGCSVEQDRHRYATHYPPGFQHHSQASVPAPKEAQLVPVTELCLKSIPSDPGRLRGCLGGPVVSTTSGKWQCPEHARQEAHKPNIVTGQVVSEYEEVRGSN